MTKTVVPDIVAPGLDVLFVGINPGLYSAAAGHNFARPGNRFWKALHAAGFTDRVLSPSEEHRLLEYRVGITNFVARASRAAADLTPEELRRGAATVRRKVCRLRPRAVAFLGVSAYRVAFDRPGASIGEQPEPMCGARVWVLPNPSGLNAHYKPADFARLYAQARAYADGLRTADQSFQ